MNQGTLKSYVAGFGLSLVFTLTAFYLVTQHALPARLLIAAVISLALAQFTAQLLLFLHLGTETSPRWKLLSFGFMLLVVAIIVFGSLWIMNNLNYHMTPTDTSNYIIKDEGFEK